MRYGRSGGPHSDPRSWPDARCIALAQARLRHNMSVVWRLERAGWSQKLDGAFTLGRLQVDGAPTYVGRHQATLRVVADGVEVEAVHNLNATGVRADGSKASGHGRQQHVGLGAQGTEGPNAYSDFRMRKGNTYREQISQSKAVLYGA